MVKTSTSQAGETPSAEEMNRLFGEAELQAQQMIEELDILARTAGQEAARAAQFSMWSLPGDILRIPADIRRALRAASVKNPAE